jgi:hypothetical protein
MKDFRKLCCFCHAVLHSSVKKRVGNLRLALGLTAITYEQSQLGVLNYCISSENTGDRSRPDRCVHIPKKRRNRLKLYPADLTYSHISAACIRSIL